MSVIFHQFNPDNPDHQDMVMGELERIVEWPLRADSWADSIEVPADLLAGLSDWKVARKK